MNKLLERLVAINQLGLLMLEVTIVVALMPIMYPFKPRWFLQWVRLVKYKALKLKEEYTEKLEKMEEEKKK